MKRDNGSSCVEIYLDGHWSIFYSFHESRIPVKDETALAELHRIHFTKGNIR